MIKTQSIKYIGSKLKLLPYIEEILKDIKFKTFFDGFSGSTRVSQFFAQKNYEVISNDISEWSYILGTCYLLNKKDKLFYKKLIDHLNNIKPIDGFFTENYGGYENNGVAVGEDGLKKLWQIHNTRKLDGIIEEINRLKLNKISRAVALTSLMLALDAVDNTMGHFTSYLKNWSPRSYKQLYLEIPELFVNNQDNKVFKEDIFEVMKNRQFDVAYLDPPYGSNNEKMPSSRVRYQSYYHIWTTICLNDKPKLVGKAKRREDDKKISVFEEYKKDKDGHFIVIKAIDKLLNELNCNYILLSYSSGGRATFENLIDIIKKNGFLIKVNKINYKKNVMASMTWTDEWLNNSSTNEEFLFLIKK